MCLWLPGQYLQDPASINVCVEPPPLTPPPPKLRLYRRGVLTRRLKTKPTKDSTLTEQERKISSCISDEGDRGKRKKEASAAKPRRWQLSGLFPEHFFFSQNSDYVFIIRLVTSCLCIFSSWSYRCMTHPAPPPLKKSKSTLLFLFILNYSVG